MTKTTSTQRRPRWLRRLAIGVALVFGAGLVVLVIADGTYLRRTYLDPWDPAYATRFEDPRIQVVAHGLLAPSAHNMQPWIVRLDANDPAGFTLHVETERLLPETDPHARQITISQGTFLELVRIAAAQRGHEAVIALFPDGEYDEAGSVPSMRQHAVARVTLRPAARVESALHDAIFRRVTTRTPYLNQRLTDEQVAQLLSLNDANGISVDIVQNTESLGRLVDLARRGVGVESRAPGPLRETDEVLRMSERAKNRHRFGIALDAQAPTPLASFFTQAAGTLFPLDETRLGDIWRDAEQPRIAATPAYLLIITDGNSRRDQVQVGMLYSRLQLAATLLGVSMQPVSQVLQEYPAMAELYREAHDAFARNGQTIQMLVRLGVAERTPLHSPRLDVGQIIE